MRHVAITRILILVVLALVLSACGAQPTVAPTATNVPPTDTRVPPPTATPRPTLTATLELAKIFPIENTNCRSGPSTQYPVQVSLNAGSEVRMLGRSADGEYYYVENPQAAGKGCWVKGSLVTVFGAVSFLPIFTPLPIPTVSYPTSAPVTVAPTAPLCGETSTIAIINNTGGLVTLYLTGPGKYTFKINTGSQSISVCPGSYSYTGYGCGGASKNGTVSPGDEITFFCVTN